jgi:hypothetical protein
MIVLLCGKLCFEAPWALDNPNRHHALSDPLATGQLRFGLSCVTSEAQRPELSALNLRIAAGNHPQPLIRARAKAAGKQKGLETDES